MITVTFLLIFLSISCKYLASYIKNIRTGDTNESDLTYWMFSYDFKSKNKEWEPEELNMLKKTRKRNSLVFLLYINFFLAFLAFNSFMAHLLDLIVTNEFNYPV
jgi:hypothetical protein